MNTEKELLELAAKSIELTLRYNYLGGRDANQPWNPLEDDGDALRLAVKLDMTIIVTAKDEISVCVGLGRFLQQEINEDIYAATRLAIVRAAAEIGKTL